MPHELIELDSAQRLVLDRATALSTEPALARLAGAGAEQLFWGVAVRPGKPTRFGTRAAARGEPETLVFGLPGNQVSVLWLRIQAVRRRGAAAGSWRPRDADTSTWDRTRLTAVLERDACSRDTRALSGGGRTSSSSSSSSSSSAVRAGNAAAPSGREPLYRARAKVVM
jgi:molybdopterin biosynthesis enzyme